MRSRRLAEVDGRALGGLRPVDLPAAGTSTSPPGGGRQRAASPRLRALSAAGGHRDDRRLDMTTTTTPSTGDQSKVVRLPGKAIADEGDITPPLTRILQALNILPDEGDLHPGRPGRRRAWRTTAERRPSRSRSHRRRQVVGDRTPGRRSSSCGAGPGLLRGRGPCNAASSHRRRDRPPRWCSRSPACSAPTSGAGRSHR